MARTNHTAIGRAGETAAAAYLLSLGYQVLARNVRFRSGEIDLVARDGETLVFVEVKTRSGTGFGTAAEAVTPQKQRRLVRLAELYLSGYDGPPCPCRFDVVTVEPSLAGGWACMVIRDAFAVS